MSWQDAVFGVGQFLFALSLVPGLRDAQKPPLFMSLPTAAVLLAFCAAYASLGLWLGAASVVLCAAMWLALAWQRWRQPVVTLTHSNGRTERVVRCHPADCDEHCDGIW